MVKSLVIVESPAKTKSIKKYLGNEYTILASYGHVRDLLPKSGSVDPNNHFDMKYEKIERNAKHVDAIAKALKKSDKLILATDPDREGEAISWHVVALMDEKNLLKNKTVERVVFNEITKTAVLEAIKNPRQISMDLVNAQQARRALDYLVGFNLSPLLWKKIRRGLSAGRVQSPALRMIVEREEEIEKFESKEYWSIIANALHNKQAFEAKLSEYQGEKIKQFTINNEKDAKACEKKLLDAANGELLVKKVEKKKRKRNPAAPFITSTLQQEASRKLGFSAKRTMRTAQQLYEGIDIGMGTVGLITYMRTDSVNLSQDALQEIRAYIESHFSKEHLPSEPRFYKTKAKNAQEAHEAIRPTSVRQTPSIIKESLTSDQFKLYELIWKRTIASQMESALINTVSVDLACGDQGIFRATGSTIAEPGFLAVYQEGTDDTQTPATPDEKFLPPLKEGERVTLSSIVSNQHFTEPPPRYGEASLVKALEEHGIGRPSTYASIIDTLQNREYVILDKKRFHPTDVGRVVNRFLTQHFTRYVDYGFTAELEDALDSVSRGEREWIPLLETFWKPFTSQIKTVDETVDRKDVTSEQLDEKCPKCNADLSIRLGRRGRFIGCTAYPDCDYTRNLGEDSSTEPEIIEDRVCPNCEKPLQVRHGRYGKFIGCTGYPDCKHIEPLEKPADTNVTCPMCKQGTILERKSRRGKIFYSCARYPDCDYALWNQPIDEVCPSCKWPILTVKHRKKGADLKLCPQEACSFSEELEEG